MTRSDTLPEDVVEDILSRLPVKPLKRFECVSSWWCALIQSPTFIAHHLRRSRQSITNSYLLVQRKDLITRNSVLSLIPDGDGNGSDDHEALVDVPAGNLFSPIFNEEQNFYLSGTCVNGIVCLYNRGQGTKVVLWNPAVREFQVLPERPIDCPPEADYDIEGLGFGYDPKADDYKVVRMVYLWQCPGPDIPPLTEVYSLRTNSWRKINPIHNYANCLNSTDSEIYLRGACHWWIGRSMLAFDMSDEDFRLIRLPNRDGLWDYKIKKSMAVLSGSIALIVRLVEGMEKSFDIWVMLEYGVEESWTKQFKIGPVLGVDRPLGFAKNGQLLLVDDNGHLVSLDFNGKEIKFLHVKWIPQLFRVTNVVPSLISVQDERLV